MGEEELQEYLRKGAFTEFLSPSISRLTNGYGRFKIHECPPVTLDPMSALTWLLFSFYAQKSFFLGPAATMPKRTVKRILVSVFVVLSLSSGLVRSSSTVLALGAQVLTALHLGDASQ